jgi:prolyl-tRNA editing enzyme YbaK/EbsC (Cys-tRNA(Pro) deacylase)
MLAHRYLEERGIPFKLVEQECATFRCIDSAEARGVSTKQIVKSMVVKAGDGYYQCLLPGHLDVDHEKLATLIGPFEMAPESDLEELTGQAVGTVHPFAGELKRFLDKRVLENEELSFTTGDPTQGVILSKEAFLEALSSFDFREADICNDPQEHYQKIAGRFGIEIHDAEFLVASEGLGYFEQLPEGLEAGEAMEWFRFLVRMAGQKGRGYEVVLPEWLSKIASSDLTDYAKKDLILKALETAEEPVIRERTADAPRIIERVIEENMGAVKQYQAGDQKVLNFLVGQGMRLSKGALDPRELREAFIKRMGMSGDS